MAKSPTKADDAGPEAPMAAETVEQKAPAAATATNVPKEEVPLVTIDEFCTRKSTDGKQTHRLTPFHSEETQAGRLTDTPEAYERRLKAMMNRPAK